MSGTRAQLASTTRLATSYCCSTLYTIPDSILVSAPQADAALSPSQEIRKRVLTGNAHALSYLSTHVHIVYKLPDMSALESLFGPTASLVEVLADTAIILKDLLAASINALQNVITASIDARQDVLAATINSLQEFLAVTTALVQRLLPDSNGAVQHFLNNKIAQLQGLLVATSQGLRDLLTRLTSEVHLVDDANANVLPFVVVKSVALRVLNEEVQAILNTRNTAD